MGNKMGKQILIVEPRGVPANVFSEYLRLPLMGTLYLGTILKRAGYEVKVMNENLLGRDLTMSDLKADYLLLSLLTPTAERGYELAQKFRALNPGSRVIIGGIHPSFLPEEAVPFADHVVVGEGEGIIADLVRYGSDQKIVTGSRMANLDDVPIPDFSLLVGHRKLKITPVITSRGCPFGCNFCSVTEMFGRGYRATSVERVMEELAQAPTQQVFFYDDNFTADRKRTHALLDQMIASKVKLLAISETQKYGHVTYFFNGNRQGKFSETYEDYVEVASDRVPFEQRPWMKCAEITDRVLEAIGSGKYAFIRLNFPNGDMVGHTGNYQAVVAGMEGMDLQLGRLKAAVEKAGGVMILTADHGNSDDMYEHDKKTGAVTRKADGTPRAKTSHSLNPVPCVIFDPETKGEYGQELHEGLGISSLAATCPDENVNRGMTSHRSQSAPPHMKKSVLWQL